MAVESKDRCGATFDKYTCERDSTHTGKHRDGGMHWTDAGAKMILEQREKEQAAREQLAVK
jgi:hypothetical protein